MANFEPAFDWMIPHEGGYADDPMDPGGETKYGISRRAYPDLNIANLSLEDARAIYLRDYWGGQPYCRLASQPVANKVFDLAVNMGQAEAHKLLQRALNDCGEHLVVDGELGELTLAAANRCDSQLLLEALRDQACRFYQLLVVRRPSSTKFLDGWLRRARA